MRYFQNVASSARRENCRLEKTRRNESALCRENSTCLNFSRLFLRVFDMSLSLNRTILRTTLISTETHVPSPWYGQYDGYAMLMSPNKGETAVHGCHCPGDMVVRMRTVLAIPRGWYVCLSADKCYFENTLSSIRKRHVDG